MAHAFYVVMRKRKDGQVYADLHKTDGRLYLGERDAEDARAELGELANRFHVVKLIALVVDEWEEVAA